MFLTQNDKQEIRIFKSRLIRIIEHKIECPVHIRHEISTIITETSNVRCGKTNIYHLDHSIVPIIRYLIDSDLELDQEYFFRDPLYDIKTTLSRLIEILDRI